MASSQSPISPYLSPPIGEHNVLVQDDDEIAHLPATELLRRLEQGPLTSSALLEIYLDRIERLNPDLNAVVTLDSDGARQRASAADAARLRGDSWGALHGLPITVKDVFETEGMRTTAGAPELSDYVPTRDAVLVSRLRDAGAVVFGKTNTPTMAGDGQTYNPLFGTTNNPWALDRTPGGSSGGCGAAVAAGLTALSFGSDIAGSIRVPAGFCGVYGHKATFGLIPQRGHIPGSPGQRIERDVNVVGPIARAASDLDLALSVLAGPMSQEALGWQATLPVAPPFALRELRVAAWLDDDFCPVDRSVLERLEALVAALRGAGASVDVEARPDIKFSGAIELYGELRREDLPHGEWLELDEQRQDHRDRWATFFERYDVLLCPISSTAAFPHDQGPREARGFVVNGMNRPYSDFVSWPRLIGPVYLPATAVPLGPNSEGLPVGVQVVGPHLSDRRTIRVAALLAEIVGGYIPPPGY